jgi:hypothetical protein
MSLANLAARTPLAVAGGALILFASYKLSGEVTTFLNDLPVLVPNKVVSAPAAGSAKPPAQGVYQVLVVPSQSAQTSGTGTEKPSSIEAEDRPEGSRESKLERLFSSKSGKSKNEAEPSKQDPKLRLPVPGQAAGRGAAPANAPEGAGPGVVETENAPPRPTNFFRIDGIANGGAFISGRYFREGEKLEGVYFPSEILAPGERATLFKVSEQEIVIMLGKRPVILSRPKE